MLKAISLWQPWAQLIALDEKRIETRGRRIQHRGEIAIHAAQRWLPEQSDLLRDEPFRTRLAYHGVTWLNVTHDLMPRGAIVAVANLIDDIDLSIDLAGTPKDFTPAAHELAFGNFGPGRRGYLLTHIRKLRRPVLCRGMQAVPFTVPDAVETIVRMELRALG